MLHTMRYLVLTLLIVCAQLSNAQVELTDSNFESKISTGKWLVKFYAPWCGHCRQMAPAFAKAARAVPDVNFGNLDATIHTEAKSKYAIKGFPTLMYFEDGQPFMPYNAGRDYESLVGFGKRMSAPAVTRIASVAAAESLMFFDSPVRKVKDNPVTVLLVLEPGSSFSGPIYEAYVSVATKQRSTRVFSATESTDVLNMVLKSGNEVLAAPKLPALFCVEKGERPKVMELSVEDTDSTPLNDTISSWVSQNALSVFAKVDGGNFNQLTSSGQKVVLAVVDPDNRNTKSYLDALGKLARSATSPDSKLYGKFVFGHMNGVMFDSFFEQYGVFSESLPRLLVLEDPSASFFMEQERDSPEQIEQFLLDIVQGRVNPRSVGALHSLYRKFLRYFPYSLLVLVGAMLLLGGCLYCISTMEDDELVDDDAMLAVEKAKNGKPKTE